MDGALDRPFYFIMVLWGERFREYFLEYCLPSLLSPHNLPVLSTRQPSKILIATTATDWAVIEASPIFHQMLRYISSEFIELPPCPPERSAYEHMSLGHKLACEMAFRDAAYAAVLTPDCMLSDGTVARLQQLACSGCQLVVAAALRFGEEAFLGQLRNMGVLPVANRSESGAPIIITGRQMAYAAVNGLHSEALAYEWDAPGFLLVVPAAWWRVPGESGILLHSLSWAPLLLDYGAIARHDSATLDRWTLDGDYLYQNLKDIDRIHVVQDSDELFLASWGPDVDRPIAKHRIPWIGKLVAKAQFGSCFKSAFFDPFKRRIFFLPVRWHSQPLNMNWKEIEDRAMHDLRHYVKPPDEALLSGANSVTEKAYRVMGSVLTTLFTILRPILIIIYHRQAVWRNFKKAVSGDRNSIRQFFWYIRLFGFNRS